MLISYEVHGQGGLLPPLAHATYYFPNLCMLTILYVSASPSERKSVRDVYCLLCWSVVSKLYRTVNGAHRRTPATRTGSNCTVTSLKFTRAMRVILRLCLL